MNETYIELMIKRPDPKSAGALHNMLLWTGVVLFIGGFFMSVVVGTACLAVGALLFILSFVVNLNTDIEYEYLYLDKELSIDKIRKQESRKKVANYKLSTMDVLAPVNSHRLDEYQNLKETNYSSLDPEGNFYQMVVEGKHGKERVTIDMTDELYNAIRMSFPRCVFKD